MSKQKQTSRKRKRQRRIPVWMSIIIAFLAFILVLVLTAGIVVNTMLSKINRPDINTDYYTEEELREIDLAEAAQEAALEGSPEQQAAEVVYPELKPEDIIWTEATEKIAEANTITNILLIGQDARSGETRARSDSMILVSFNKGAGTITMTSFLRDLYVQIPGYNDNRLNAAYAFGGMSLLDETIEKNFGVHIDANLEVRFEVFSQIIDMLGGVDITLTNAEANYMSLPSGENHMDGDTALRYARIRYLDSDFGRTGRQRNVLTSIYHNFKNASLTKVLQLVNEIFPMLTTDLTNSEIVAYAADLFPMMASSDLNSMYIPAEGTYSFNTIDSMAVIVADMEANRSVLKSALEPELP